MFFKKEFMSIFWIFEETYFWVRQIMVNWPNFGCLPNTGYIPLYTMMSHFATFGRIALFINWWATSRPLASQYNGGPLCGPFTIFSMHPEFGEFTLFWIEACVPDWNSCCMNSIAVMPINFVSLRKKRQYWLIEVFYINSVMFNDWSDISSCLLGKVT